MNSGKGPTVSIKVVFIEWKYKTENEARSCNHCCNSKTISTTYYECVFVALGTLREKHMRPIAICGLSGSTIFFHIIT